MGFAKLYVVLLKSIAVSLKGIIRSVRAGVLAYVFTINIRRLIY